MKKKDITLFNKAIHQAKNVVGNLSSDIQKLELVIGELYELFDDLYGEKENEIKN